MAALAPSWPAFTFPPISSYSSWLIAQNCTIWSLLEPTMQRSYIFRKCTQKLLYWTAVYVYRFSGWSFKHHLIKKKHIFLIKWELFLSFFYSEFACKLTIIHILIFFLLLFSRVTFILLKRSLISLHFKFLLSASKCFFSMFCHFHICGFKTLFSPKLSWICFSRRLYNHVRLW